MRWPCLIVVLLQGCNWISNPTLDDRLDGDGDGASMEDDACDDNPSMVQPLPYLVDADGDGFGDPTRVEALCFLEAPDGYATLDDCDDTDPAIHEPIAWTVDGDGDGFGGTVVALHCTTEPPEGFTDNDHDCNDADSTIHPGAIEQCGDTDLDCDGLFDDDPDIANPLATWLPDADGDGFGDADALATVTPTRCPEPGLVLFTGDADCNDADSTVSPDAAEACDGIDNNCNDEVDENFAIPEYYRDADEDGAPDPLTSATLCEPAPGWIPAADFEDSEALAAAADCDDNDATVSPTSPEVFGDGIDQDCDPLTEWDEDGDGFVRPGAPAGQIDCDDANPAIHPTAAEVFYDDIDQDCDPSNDDDQDGDGFPAADRGGTDCVDTDPAVNPDATELYYDDIDNDCSSATRDDDQDGDGALADASGGTDCDDTDPTVGPGVAEVPYDDIDNDCNSATRDDDADGDGAIADFAGGSDCDDANADIFPGAPEAYYDGVDQDCDPTNDDDQDGDGFSVPDDCADIDPLIHPGRDEIYYDAIDNDCDPSTLDGDADGDGSISTSVGGTDCNDSDPTVFPGAFEVPDDGVDNNCDPLGAPGRTCFTDADRDGIGAGIGTGYDVDACVDGLSNRDDDCDDLDPDVFPGATEFCDNIDGNCDGIVDDGLVTLFDNAGTPLDLTPMLGGPIAITDDMGPSVLIQVCGSDLGTPLEMGLSTTTSSDIERVVVRGLKPLNAVSGVGIHALYTGGYNDTVVRFEDVDYRPTTDAHGISVYFGPEVEWFGGSIELIDSADPWLAADHVSAVTLEQTTIHSHPTADQIFFDGSFVNLTLDGITVGDLGAKLVELQSGSLTAVDLEFTGGTMSSKVFSGTSIDALLLDGRIRDTVIDGALFGLNASDLVVYQTDFADLTLAAPLVDASESDVLLLSSTVGGIETEHPLVRGNETSIQLVNDRINVARTSATIAELEGGSLTVTDGRFEVPEAPEHYPFALIGASMDMEGTRVLSPTAGAPQLLTAERSTIQLRAVDFGQFNDAGARSVASAPAVAVRESDLVLDDSILVRELCSDGRFPPCSALPTATPLIEARTGSVTVFGGALLNADGPVLEVTDTRVTVGDPSSPRPFSAAATGYGCDDLRYGPDGLGGGDKSAMEGPASYPRIIAGGPAITGRTEDADVGMCGYAVPTQSLLTTLECTSADTEPIGVSCDASACVCL